MGIDATIPENVPRERYERITYAYTETAKVEDYEKGKADAAGKTVDDAELGDLADSILALIAEKPLYYTEVAEHFGAYDFRTIARAIGLLHETEKLWQDPKGRMCERGSKFAAVPPTK